MPRPQTPADLLRVVRTYVRERAPVVGFRTAVDEVRDTLRQVRLFGTSIRAHAHSEDAMRKYSALTNSVGHL